MWHHNQTHLLLIQGDFYNCFVYASLWILAATSNIIDVSEHGDTSLPRCDISSGTDGPAMLFGAVRPCCLHWIRESVTLLLVECTVVGPCRYPVLSVSLRQDRIGCNRSYSVTLTDVRFTCGGRRLLDSSFIMCKRKLYHVTFSLTPDKLSPLKNENCQDLRMIF